MRRLPGLAINTLAAVVAGTLLAAVGAAVWEVVGEEALSMPVGGAIALAILGRPAQQKMAHRSGTAAPRSLGSQLSELGRKVGKFRTPAVRVIPPTHKIAANAYATAHARRGGAVLVTPLLLSLPPAARRGVLAHELGHLVHGDTALTVLVSTIRRAVDAVCAFALARIMLGAAAPALGVLGVELGVTGQPAVGVGGAGLAGLAVGRFVERWASRIRERSADRLARRLVGAEPFSASLYAVWSAGVGGAPPGARPARPTALRRLLSSHPPMSDRIREAAPNSSVL